MALFQEGWADHYAGMIDWIGPEFGGGKVSVDPAGMAVTIDGERTAVDVCNVIPAMKAGRIAELAGVTDGNWAPVSAYDMSSKADPDIHVLGDAAQQGDMPKSGFSANSQAKVCANAVRGALTGSKVFPARYSNTCWSLISAENGVKVGASYEATDEKIAKTAGFISGTGETAELCARPPTRNRKAGIPASRPTCSADLPARRRAGRRAKPSPARRSRPAFQEGSRARLGASQRSASAGAMPLRRA